MQYIAYIFIAFVAFIISGGLFGNFGGGLLASVLIFFIMIILEKLSEINKKLNVIIKNQNKEG